MAAKSETALEAPRAVDVTLGDGRLVHLREPRSTEYLRLMAAQTAIVAFKSGEEIGEAEEAHIRRAIALLAVTDAGELTEDDVLAVSAPDWARLFVGLMQIMNEVNRDPLVTPKSAKSKSSSSPSAPAAKPTSPDGSAS